MVYPLFNVHMNLNLFRFLCESYWLRRLHMVKGKLCSRIYEIKFVGRLFNIPPALQFVVLLKKPYREPEY